MTAECPTPNPPAPAICEQSAGQATLEFVGVLPLALLCGLLLIQAFLIGATTVLAHSAAVQVSRGVREQPDLPAAWKHGARVSETDSTVTVRLQSPRVVPVGRLPIVARSEQVPT